MSLASTLADFVARPPLGLVLAIPVVAAGAWAALRLGRAPKRAVRPSAYSSTDADLVSRTWHALERRRYSTVLEAATDHLSEYSHRQLGVALDRIPGPISAWRRPIPASLTEVRRLGGRLRSATGRAHRLEAWWWPRWDFWRPLPVSQARLLSTVAPLVREVDRLTFGGPA